MNKSRTNFGNQESDQISSHHSSVDKNIQKRKRRFLDSYYLNSSISSGKNINLPLSIFRNELSGLESIVTYLKESLGLRFCQIAQLLNRDDRTIWDSHHAATKKQTEPFNSIETPITIPLSACADRSLSILESLVVFLKEELQTKNCEIANLLNKDARTVWTVYSRAQKKRKNAEAT